MRDQIVLPATCGALRTRICAGGVRAAARAADEAAGSLRSSPAEQAPDESARDAKQGGLGEPRAADLRGGDPERSQDPDFLASANDGAVERLKDEVESDQKREQRKDGEVETERAGHDGAGVASVGRRGDAPTARADGVEGGTELGASCVVTGAR